MQPHLIFTSLTLQITFSYILIFLPLDHQIWQLLHISSLYQVVFQIQTDIPNLGSFGTFWSRYSDLNAFVTSFREHLRLMGYTDAIMCRLFLTCLEMTAWDWYIALSSGSVHNFDQLSKLFLAHFRSIQKSEITCESLLTLKQSTGESTHEFIDRFVDVSRQVRDFDDKIALFVIRKGLSKETLRFEAHKIIFHTLQEFVDFVSAYVRREENAYSSGDEITTLPATYQTTSHNNRAWRPPPARK